MPTSSTAGLLLFVLTPMLAAQAPTQFALRTPTNLGLASLREAVAADFDGDGDLDLCGGGGAFTNGQQRLLRNDSGERFTNVTAVNLPTALSTTLMTVAFDMEGDGDIDLFVSKQLNPSRLWRNDGAGVFTDASAGLPASANDQLAVVAGDFDGDGDIDLVATAGYFSFSPDRVFANDGTGVFSAIALNLGPATTALATADFDGDGDLDLVVGSQSGPRLYRNDGNFVFTDVSATWLTAGGTAPTYAVAFGDLDGDGDVDLVCGRQNVLTDLILSNTGTTFVLAATLPTTSAGTKSIVLADYDDDGDLDIARSIISSRIELSINDGTGTFVPEAGRLPSLFVASPSLLAADLDRDGDVELLSCDQLLGTNLLINRHRDLVVDTPLIGQTWTVDVWSAPGYATLNHTCRLGIGIAALPMPLTVPGFGELWVDLDAGYFLAEDVVLASNGHQPFPFAVPLLPPLAGLELHVQAVIEQAPGVAHFTAYRSVVVQ